MPMITDWLTTGAAALTMFAAFAALAVAWRAPRMAAQFAEDLRVKNEAANEKQKLRQFIFVTLMRCRKQLLHPDAVSAINLVDVAFADSSMVRGGYKSFIQATLEQPHQPIKIVERYHTLIDRIGTELEYGPLIGPSDIQGGYYPEGLGRLDEAALAEADDKTARAQARPKT